MSKKFLCLMATLVAFSSSVCAQEVKEGVQSFQSNNNNGVKREDKSSEIKPLPEFEKLAGRTAMNNIFNAEQVFCYEVFPPSLDYKGYTLDNLPIRGFCGVLDKKTREAVTPFFFSNPSAVDFEAIDNCSMQPRMILRFVRGVDFTDVMFSSPCASIAIFYAGKISIFNYGPITKELEEIVKQMEKLHETFVSPALLDQLLPMGVAKTEQERGLINKVNEPIRNWEKQATEKLKKQDEEVQRQNTGWNKLKNKRN